MTKSCDVDPQVESREPSSPLTTGIPRPPSRRQFMKRLGLGAAGLSCADFLAYFLTFGMPAQGRVEQAS